ncbi:MULTISPECIES: SDR family NAD(P)-dependent oxidoreductase [Sinorhizobium]|uniref:3-oxoacyl-ACP reductase n=2 Tax=Sinorhizobium TaxID=28105 RepID=A0A2S3YHU3_9HYPH|nr:MULTISPECIES: SDR family oxidoreductase [Sinorhizobium]ASY55485.1 3-oxoacyl-[acyl-carrier protein] reductase [Sinorhizobium sp. CCBAU 05631]AUX75430.1 3-oxoacyl-(acyl-carrier-protein) reductase protein [Sinorhizobium fredii]PDT40725.1 3-oxoacyl-ACP reductase [Sinorhizobium sp. FG01]POH26322.1 3-oxoacyl-ACP reductase [Sinorhizobium americanum]
MTLPSSQFPDLRDRGVLVTGGASGIGAALVEGFLRQGARVAFIDIAEDAGRALADRLAAEIGQRPEFVRADLRDVEQARSAADAAVAALGPIRVLINNAARDDRQPLEEVTRESWDESLAVNLRHFFFLAQAIAPHMRQAGGGSIINFSSIAFMLNMPEMPAYATAKAGIIGLTKSLAGKLGPDNIRVNAILPGMIVTERQKRLWLTQDSIARMQERQCLKRVLAAEDLVGPCLFLASDCSAAMTAQSMIIDGGVF